MTSASQLHSNHEDNDFEITVGLEFEFLGLTDKFVLDGEAGDDLRGRGFSPEYIRDELRRRAGDKFRKLVVGNLRRAEVPTNDYDLRRIHDYDTSKWTVDVDGTVMPHDELDGPTLKLAGGQVIEINDSLRDNVHFIDVEVKSRILLVNEISFLEIQSAVTAITKNLPVVVNHHCAFHVHVGNRDKGFPFNMIKDFVYLVLMAEAQINEIHPPDRLSGSCAHQLSLAFNTKDRHPLGMAQIVEDFQSLDELVMFLHSHRPWRGEEEGVFDKYFAYNFLGLLQGDPAKKARKVTIEFRQHAGTLDPNVALRWTLFAASAVVASRNMTSFFKANLLAKVNDPGYDIFALLTDLDLGYLAEAFQGKTFSHDRSEAPEDPWSDEDTDSDSGERPIMGANRGIHDLWV